MLYLKCTKITRFSDTKCIAINSNTNSQVRFFNICTDTNKCDVWKWVIFKCDFMSEKFSYHFMIFDPL